MGRIIVWFVTVWIPVGAPINIAPREIPEHLLIQEWEHTRFGVASGESARAMLKLNETIYEQYEAAVYHNNTKERYEQWRSEMEFCRLAWAHLALAIEPQSQWCVDTEKPADDDTLWFYYRISSLGSLRDILGHRAYYTGQMPPAAPNLRVYYGK
jgi:hypothetical protein